jgi:hypothetical protein
VRQRVERTIQRLEGARATHQLAPQPPPTPPPSGPHRLRPWIIATGSLSAGLVAVGAILAARAAAIAPPANPTTGNGVSADDLARDAKAARSSAIGADVCFSLAGASALGAIVMGVVAASSSGVPPPPVAAAPVLAPGYAGGVVAWSF